MKFVGLHSLRLVIGNVQFIICFGPSSRIIITIRFYSILPDWSAVERAYTHCKLLLINLRFCMVFVILVLLRVHTFSPSRRGCTGTGTRRRALCRRRGCCRAWRRTAARARRSAARASRARMRTRRPRPPPPHRPPPANSCRTCTETARTLLLGRTGLEHITRL